MKRHERSRGGFLKPILNSVAILFLCLAAPLHLARAQDVSGYVGFGAAFDASTGKQIDTFSDGTLYKTPTLRAPMAQLGMNVYFSKHWGAGAEISRRLGQGDYAGLNYSLSFSSIDAVFRTASQTTKQFEPEYRIGIGVARLHYSFNDQSSCDQVPGCPVSTHFQARFAAAARLYVSNHVFFRPAVDLHYVPGFSDFRHDVVPEFSIGFGYSLGR
jgi:hypothetical protein